MFSKSIRDEPPFKSFPIIEQLVKKTGVGVGHSASPLTMPELSTTLSVTFPDFK